MFGGAPPRMLNSVVNVCCEIVNHRDTENTEVAQRNPPKRLPRIRTAFPEGFECSKELESSERNGPGQWIDCEPDQTRQYICRRRNSRAAADRSRTAVLVRRALRKQLIRHDLER